MSSATKTEEFMNKIAEEAIQEVLVMALTEKSRVMIYREEQRRFWKDDIHAFIEDNNLTLLSNEKDMEYALDWLEDKWDSNLSHWQNIGNAIENCLEYLNEGESYNE